LRACGDVIGKGLRHFERTEHVDGDDVVQQLAVEGSECLAAARTEGAGVIDQHVDQRPAVFRGKRRDRCGVGHVEALDLDGRLAHGEILQVLRGGRIAGGCDHGPLLGGILAGELEADAAVGASHQNSLGLRRQGQQNQNRG
jgi:hypothetical protein